MSTNPIGTIREAFLQASSFLQQRGVQEHQFVAELLLRHLLGWDRSQLFLQWNEIFPAMREDEWQQLLERKAMGEPAQYIIGEEAFYGMMLYVSPAVLIPRPETELLVEAIVARGRTLWPNGSPLLADIGTGSGAIPVSIAMQCPAWQVTASDISPEALLVAKQNADRYQLGKRIVFYEGDLLTPFIQHQVAVDILISNPPYIASDAITTLQPEVRLYEPKTALDGGRDGLTLYRRMMKQIVNLPKLPSLIGLEVGQGQAQEVAAMLESLPYWDRIEIIPDLANIERHVIGIRAN